MHPVPGAKFLEPVLPPERPPPDIPAPLRGPCGAGGPTRSSASSAAWRTSAGQRVRTCRGIGSPSPTAPVVRLADDRNGEVTLTAESVTQYEVWSFSKVERLHSNSGPPNGGLSTRRNAPDHDPDRFGQNAAPKRSRKWTASFRMAHKTRTGTTAMASRSARTTASRVVSGGPARSVGRLASWWPREP